MGNISHRSILNPAGNRLVRFGFQAQTSREVACGRAREKRKVEQSLYSYFKEFVGHAAYLHSSLVALSTVHIRSTARRHCWLIKQVPNQKEMWEIWNGE